jgi:hypothetical protein
MHPVAHKQLPYRLSRQLQWCSSRLTDMCAVSACVFLSLCRVSSFFLPQADAFVQIDQQYYAALQGCTGDSAGTTALAALVLGGTLYVANAGEGSGSQHAGAAEAHGAAGWPAHSWADVCRAVAQLQLHTAPCLCCCSSPVATQQHASMARPSLC